MKQHFSPAEANHQHPTWRDALRARATVMVRNLFPRLSDLPEGVKWEYAGAARDAPSTDSGWKVFAPTPSLRRDIPTLTTLRFRPRRELAETIRANRRIADVKGGEPATHPRLALAERVGRTAAICAQFTTAQVASIENASDGFVEVALRRTRRNREVAVGMFTPTEQQFEPYQTPAGQGFTIHSNYVPQEGYEHSVLTPDTAVIQMYANASLPQFQPNRPASQ